jgi:hypothetical protein
LVAGVLQAVGVPAERYLPEFEPLTAFAGA